MKLAISETGATTWNWATEKTLSDNLETKDGPVPSSCFRSQWKRQWIMEPTQ